MLGTVKTVGVIIAELCAGIFQGITGFGAGIISMLALPAMFPVTQAAGISGAVCLSLTASMVIKYRKYINFRKAIFPTILYTFLSAVAIRFSAGLDQALMKRALGGFLILLSLYYLFVKRDGSKKLSLPVSILFTAVSGACDGLFSIGSPLMVIYYLSQTDSKEEYLGTIQFLFMTCLIYNLFARIHNGILRPMHIPIIILGVLCIASGLFIANRLADRINEERLKKISYVGIGFAGLINLLGL